MKTKLFSIFILTVVFVKAQTYSISPAKTVTFTAALNNITVNDIYQTNTGSSPITLLWESISATGPASWQYSMCDLGTCYPGLPPGPTAMNTVSVGAQGFLGINVDPGSTPGSAIVKTFVYQQGFKSNGDTLTWYINAGPAAIEEIFGNGTIKIFPNPVVNSLNIDLTNTGATTLIIKDAIGRTVIMKNIEAGNHSLDISDLPKGFYILQIETKDRTLIKRIIKE
jgi:hypothetical protein